MTSCPDVIVALFHNPLSEPFVVLSSGFTSYFLCTNLCSLKAAADYMSEANVVHTYTVVL